MAKDLYGNEVNVGDYVITTPPHYRDTPFITKAMAVGPTAITIEFSYSEIFGEHADRKVQRSVRKGFIKIAKDMALAIMARKLAGEEYDNMASSTEQH